MGEQIFDRVKRILTILLAICFLMSIPASVASAATAPGDMKKWNDEKNKWDKENKNWNNEQKKWNNEQNNWNNEQNNWDKEKRE